MGLNNVGAPKGGRVHWFWHYLNDFTKERYVVRFDYAEHNYFCYRKEKSRLLSVLIIVRTSPLCFRVTYHNVITKKSFYRSFKSAKKLADWFNKFVLTEDKFETEALELEKLKKCFSARLRKIMREKSVTQTALAQELNLRQQTISKWLKKEYLPPPATIEQVANFFEVGFEYFTGEKI